MTHAIFFAKLAKASIDVLMVLDKQRLIDAKNRLPKDIIDEVQRSFESNVNESINQFIEENTNSDVSIKPVIKKGDPFEEIVHYSNEANTDLIVMGTHGRSGMKHMVMGSVTERVLRKSACPLLCNSGHHRKSCPPPSGHFSSVKR